MHNNKIQAFAVMDDGQIIWQTDNWNLVKDVNDLVESITKTKREVVIAKISYKIIEKTEDALIASSSEEKGHILMARTRSNSWLVAWATQDSIPELAIIDLKYAAARIR